MARTTYGQRDVCCYCGQDIEFHGKARGWLDRGSDRLCQLIPDPNPHNRGAWIKPGRPILHKPHREA